MSAPRNPFKFLDAYEAEDRDIFFGREKEVQQLYSRLSYNDILLVYGVSGCGKTSLLKCGLATRFMEELPDGAMMSNWLPVFVRRGENIKVSTIRQLQRNLPEEMKREPAKDLQVLTEQLFLAYRRDIHIIFDQLEELFIFGNEQEREDFTQMLLALQQAGHCKVILSIREEYLAHLSELEKSPSGVPASAAVVRVRATRMTPPSGMASLAFSTRFTTRFSICSLSPIIGGPPSSICFSMAIPSPTVRSSIPIMFSTMVPSSRGPISSGSCFPKDIS